MFVSNHFHSVKSLLFSSARPRDFDGMLGTEFPVSMYSMKTPIDMGHFNVPRLISIKLFYLYQRLQCTDNYFFEIKFVFLIYLQL